MAGKDIIMVRQKELRRLHIVHKVLEGEITQKKAAALASLSERQIRRIVRRIEQEGDAGIRHRLRGKESNRKKPQKLKDKVIALYLKKYQGFGPTLASEKLLEIDHIPVSDETLRLWLIEAGIWKGKRSRKKHRQWRQRKAHCGEMVQMDGSHHDWFEGRGPMCVLMGYIDDATGRVYARFYEYEGTLPAMDSFKRYVRRYGMPMSVYLDKHTTYKSWAKLTDEEIMAGVEHPMSQFERALHELGVEVIHAHSPQAKGRIERLFGTLQDRLVKEMRLRGISSILEANKFLQEYLPVYNRKFTVKAVSKEDLHQPVPRSIDLNKVLCIRTNRTVRNDHTIAHNKKLYQIEERTMSKKVVVEERIDGRMVIVGQGKALRYRQINERPEIKKKLTVRKKQQAYVPPKDHPWRQFDINRYKRKAPQTAAA